MDLDRRTKDITGQRFGMLVAITFSEYRQDRKDGKRNGWWLFKCDCGNEVVLRGYSVKSGNTNSCGCLHRDMLTKRNTKHGQATRGITKVYSIWGAMKKRCCNPNDQNYHNYGGRGITVCDSWLNDFEAFYNDMGDPPSPTHSIDRIDNNGDYCKENCRWATPEDQVNNTRRNIYLIYDDVKYSLAQLCKHLNLEYWEVYPKYYNGRRIEDLIPGAKPA